MTRTRSEYRLSPIQVTSASCALKLDHPVDTQRDALAELMLDAYRNTIDDEGEDLDDARSAVDEYFDTIVRPHSYVMLDDVVPVAFSFVVIVNDVLYIDPVVVASARKRQGVARAMVECCLRSMAEDGVLEVGATITDGNVASEALFAGLGFVRRGSWP